MCPVVVRQINQSQSDVSQRASSYAMFSTETSATTDRFSSVCIKWHRFALIRRYGVRME